jgi:flavin reductase (DIM6/NTAB) family NADH-FMN oxidoreductase RutF
MSGADDLHELVAKLDYPMAIVTVPVARAAPQSGERASGCLVGFWTQCSIDPPRWLVAVSKANHTHEPATGATTVVVHVLDADDRALAETFGELSGDDVDKLSLVPWSAGPDGVPVLDGAAAWFAGRVVDRVDLGDHIGLVLDVADVEVRRWRGQLGFQAVKDLDAGHPPDE